MQTNTVKKNEAGLPPWLARITVQVPYRKPGNVIKQLPVSFSLFGKEGRYTAVPVCTDEIKRLADLPAAFSFQVQHKKVGCRRMDLKAVAQDLMRQLKKEKADPASRPFGL